MSQSFYRSIRFFLYLLVIGFCIQLFSAKPVAAQLFQPQQPPIPQEKPQKMSFQPPANAANFSDFFPGRAQVFDLKETRGNVSVPLPNNKHNAVAFNRGAVNLVIEKDTFPNDVMIQFEANNFEQMERRPEKPEIPETLLQFSIEAEDQESEQLIHQFEKNVRLVIDFRTLGYPLDDGTDRDFYLAYRDPDPEKSNIWYDVAKL